MGSVSTLLRQCAVMAALAAVLVWAAPAEAKLWVAVTGAVLLAVFLAVSLYRHRQIRRLAEEIDEVLHSGPHGGLLELPRGRCGRARQ